MIDVSKLGKDGAFFVIAGPCVIEGEEFLMKAARRHAQRNYRYL